jgi:hypothetical protein
MDLGWVGVSCIILFYENLRVRSCIFFEMYLSHIYKPDIVTILTFTSEISKSASIRVQFSWRGIDLSWGRIFIELNV